MRKVLAEVVLLVIVGSGTWVLTSNAQTSGRVALDPTQEDQLPAAIIGNAQPLGGQAVSYFPDDPKTWGYLAVPDGPGPHGAVILVHEWNGLVDRVRQVADALAAEGYVALAADVYSGRTGSNPQENVALVQETLAKPEVLVANLDAAAAYLRARPDVSGKIAAMGWCYGGGVAHEATAIFYGRLLDDPEQLRHLNHEIYGTFAGLDQGPSPEEVGKFVEALREAGVPNDIHIYDGVNHAFWLFVDQDFAKRNTAALDAWQRLKAYLSRTIGN